MVVVVVLGGEMVTAVELMIVMAVVVADVLVFTPGRTTTAASLRLPVPRPTHHHSSLNITRPQSVQPRYRKRSNYHLGY